MSKEIKAQSSKDMEKLSQKVEENLQNINEKVEKRLEKGFENIDKTFKDIIVGIARIGEAQKKIETLSSDVNSLQNVLTDKKSRGIFGEVQLNSILKSIFGEKKDMYDLQYSFASGVIVDAVVKAPEPLGLISIDSKFPMENYTRMIDDKKFTSDFRQNIKKHVNDIASKYIIKGTTADMAILFLPAEAIFAEINAYHEELIEYARKRGVWIASPTTIMALLTTITAIVRDIKTQEQAKKIQEELMKLSSNFKLYKKRWDNLSKHIDTVSKDVKEITTSTNKISSEFERIERVEFDESDKNFLENSE
jgi:DNA recombination protein RmuC